MRNVVKTIGPMGTVRGLIIEGPNGTDGVSTVAGDPVLIKGNIPGTACEDIRSDGTCEVLVSDHIAEFAVVGANSGGNAALVAGGLCYMTSAGVLNGDSGGTLFGVLYGSKLTDNALGTDTISGTLVSSGATTTVRVWVGRKVG